MRLLFGQFRDKTGILSRQPLGTPVSGYPVKCNNSYCLQNNCAVINCRHKKGVVMDGKRVAKFSKNPTE